MAGRVTQVVLEVLHQANPNARVTQVVLEVLVPIPTTRIIAPAAAASASALPPGISTDVTIAVPPASASADVPPPTLAGVVIACVPAQAQASALAPAILTDVTIICVPAEATAALIQPIQVNSQINVTLFAPAASATASLPEVTFSRDRTIVAVAAAASASAGVVAFSAGRTIRDLLAWPDHTLIPICRVTLGGAYTDSSDGDPQPGAHAYRPLTYDPTGAVSLLVSEAEIRTGMSIGSLQPATARVTLPQTALALDPAPASRLPLLIDLGYWDPVTLTPLYARCFTGWTAALGKAYWPYSQTLQGVGMLHRPTQPLKEHTTITDLAEWEAVRQLLDRGAVLAWDLDGLEDHIGVQHDLVVAENTPPSQMLGELDSMSLYLTHDTPTGVVKRRRLPGVAGVGLDTSSSALLSNHWSALSYAILDGAAPSSDPTAVRNRVKVLGWIPADPLLERSEHTRHDDSPYIPSDKPKYITHPITSDAIEFDILAQDIAQAQQRYRNRLIQRWTIPTPGNPYLEVGAVVDLLHTELGLNPGQHFVVFEVSHRYSTTPPLWRTELVCEDTNVAVSGTQEDTHPVAAFSYSASGPDVNGFTTVTCDGSGSYDPDGTDTNLDFTWENDQTAATLSGSGVTAAGTYVVVFDAAQWAIGPSVKLTVTDADRLRSTLWQRVDR